MRSFLLDHAENRESVACNYFLFIVNFVLMVHTNLRAFHMSFLYSWTKFQALVGQMLRLLAFSQMITVHFQKENKHNFFYQNEEILLLSRLFLELFLIRFLLLST